MCHSWLEFKYIFCGKAGKSYIFHAQKAGKQHLFGTKKAGFLKFHISGNPVVGPRVVLLYFVVLFGNLKKSVVLCPTFSTFVVLL